MKRNERTTYNQLKKTVNESTLYVEVPTNWTHEARQATHELLTIEKHFTALRINWNPIENMYCILYYNSNNEEIRKSQENKDIDDVMLDLSTTDTWWNGYHKHEKPTSTEETTEEEEKETMKRTEAIKKTIENTKARSAWAKGVRLYAYELAEELEEGINGGWYYEDDLDAPKILSKMLLNGAEDWKQYSWGGSALIYDGDIAERLCNPSELKKTNHGQRRPNSREEWLDTQARALFQASQMVMEAVRATRATA
jgi:hypothetical protein